MGTDTEQAGAAYFDAVAAWTETIAIEGARHLEATVAREFDGPAGPREFTRERFSILVLEAFGAGVTAVQRNHPPARPSAGHVRIAVTNLQQTGSGVCAVGLEVSSDREFVGPAARLKLGAGERAVCTIGMIVHGERFHLTAYSGNVPPTAWPFLFKPAEDQDGVEGGPAVEPSAVGRSAIAEALALAFTKRAEARAALEAATCIVEVPR